MSYTDKCWAVLLCSVFASGSPDEAVASDPYQLPQETAVRHFIQEEKGKKRLSEEEVEATTNESLPEDSSAEKPTKRARAAAEEESKSTSEEVAIPVQKEAPQASTTPTDPALTSGSDLLCPELSSEIWGLIIKHVITRYIYDCTITTYEKEEVAVEEVADITPATYYSLAKPYGEPVDFQINYTQEQTLKMRSVCKLFYYIVNNLYSLPVNFNTIQLSKLTAFKETWRLPTNLALSFSCCDKEQAIRNKLLFDKLSKLLAEEGGPLILKTLKMRIDGRHPHLKIYSELLHRLSKNSANLDELLIDFEFDNMGKKWRKKWRYEDTQALVDDGIRALSNLIDPKRTPYLRVLDLTNFYYHMDATLISIYPHLRDHPNLKTLVFMQTHISDIGAIHLAEALRGNRSIRAIVMQNNDIGEAGVSALLLSLYYNNTLESLDLTGSCPISKRFIEPIFACLKHNNSLRELGIHGYKRIPELEEDDNTDDSEDSDNSEASEEEENQAARVVGDIRAYDLRVHKSSLMETLPEGPFRTRLENIIFFDMRY